MTKRSITDAMMEGEPFARYKKMILGKVYVTALDPFSDEPEGIVLYGNPNNPDQLDTQIIEIWDERQDLFFRKVNKKHFETGRLGLVEQVEETPVSPNDVTDAFLDTLLDGRKTRFLAFKNRLNEFTSEAPLFRLLNRARELEKSEKLIKHIETKLAEVQQEPYDTRPEVQVVSRA